MRMIGLLIILTLLLTGCGGVSPATPNPGPLTREAKSGDLVAGVKVQAAQVKPGDTFDVEIWAENRGKTPALIEGCGPGVYLVITGPGGANLPAREKGDERGYCAAIMDAELKPGQRLAYTFTVTVPAYPAAEPVPAGTYAVAAVLKRGPVANPPQPLKAEVEVQVGAGTQVLTRQDARAKAEADSRVKEWLAARPTPLAEMTGSARFVDGLWELTWATKQGSPPHRMIAKVDARTGEVKVVQFLDR